MKNKDKLAELLSQADNTAAGPSIQEPQQLSFQIRRKYQSKIRRTRAIQTGGVLSIILGLCCLVYSVNYSSNDQQMIDNQRQYIALSMQTEHTVNLLRRINQQAQYDKRGKHLRRQLAQLTVRSEMKINSDDKQALKLMHHAQLMQKSQKSPDAANRTYKNIIKYFPNSHYTKLAREELANVK